MSGLSFPYVQGRGVLRWLLLLIFSLVPGIAWVWFFNRQDSADREPLRLLVKVFIFGMVSVVPAALLEIPFRNYLTASIHPMARLISLIVFVGLVEEFMKFLAFYVAVYNVDDFNEPLDGVIYAVTAALGFATIENVLYSASFGLGVIPARAVVASLAHASFSGLVGFYVAMVKFRRQPWTVGLGGLVLAAVLHGLYNFVIVDGTVSAALAIPMVYLVYRFLSKKIREARALSPY